MNGMLRVNNIFESDNSIEIRQAKMNEFEHQKDHEVFEEVEHEWQRVIIVRWVITKKNKDQKLTYLVMTRLVPRNVQELDGDNQQMNCLSVIDHFVGLALKRLNLEN